MFEQNLFGDDVKPESQGGELSKTWEYPPFSILNAREGWWQERKRQWLSLGIKSELGRGATGVNSPHEGKGMADGLVAVRAAQKAARNGAVPGGGAGVVQSTEKDLLSSIQRGLTWGNSPQITQKGLNYYRNKNGQER